MSAFIQTLNKMNESDLRSKLSECFGHPSLCKESLDAAVKAKPFESIEQGFFYLFCFF